MIILFNIPLPHFLISKTITFGTARTIMPACLVES